MSTPPDKPIVVKTQMVDINDPEDVEIMISGDHKKLWINIDGVCRLRVYNCHRIRFGDDFKPFIIKPE